MTEEAEVIADVVEDVAEEVTDQVEGDESEAEGEPEAVEPVKPKVTFTPEQQEVFDREIGKKTAAMREVERRYEDAERQLKEVSSKIPPATRPDIPAFPDPYDDNYETRLAERDKALLQAARFDAQQEAQQERRQQEAQREEHEKQQAILKEGATYAERAKKLGIKPEELQPAGNLVGNYGLNQDTAYRIMRDEQGPAITVYLANNPVVLDDLRRMNPIDAAVKLATEIRPAAQNARKKPEPAPDPTETLRGTGQPEGGRGPKGARFE